MLFETVITSHGLSKKSSIVFLTSSFGIKGSSPWRLSMKLFSFKLSFFAASYTLSVPDICSGLVITTLLVISFKLSFTKTESVAT